MHWMFLPLKRYADFEGRSRRMEFWMFTLFTTIVAVVLLGPAVVTLVGASLTESVAVDEDPLTYVSGLGMAGLGLWAIFALAVLIPGIAVAVRRLHDRNLSGWWYLGMIVASFVPLIGGLASIAYLVVMLLPGTDGPNRFGPDPKDPHSAAVFE